MGDCDYVRYLVANRGEVTGVFFEDKEKALAYARCHGKAVIEFSYTLSGSKLIRA